MKDFFIDPQIGLHKVLHKTNEVWPNNMAATQLVWKNQNFIH